jgi:hypothetical protein
MVFAQFCHIAAPVHFFDTDNGRTSLPQRSSQSISHYLYFFARKELFPQQ